MENILKFKKNITSKTKFYERTAEEDVIYKHHLKIKTKPEDFTKFLPKMENEDLYQLFFHYYHEWHRLNCGDSCKGPEILEYCFNQSKSLKELFKTLFFYVNKIKLIKMLNLLKKKEVITYYEGELSYEEVESRLTTEQTWGTDKKIYRLFFDHLKLKTPVLEFQSIIQKQPKKLFKLAYYYIVTQYWYYFSGIYYEDIKYEDSFFYFLVIKGIRKSQIYHPRTQKIAYFYLNKIRLIQ